MTETITETRAPNPGLTSRARGGGLPAYDIPVGFIQPDPAQPRTGEPDTEGLERLANSLATHGQIQPICVRRGDEPYRYVIVSGERRWRAAVSAGLSTVTAVILGGKLTDTQRLELQVVENLLREDLTPIDQARAFRALMDAHGWSGRELARTLNVRDTTVSRALALLELPQSVVDEVASGRLAPSVAVEIAKVCGYDNQRVLAARVVAEGLSRAQTIDAIRKMNAPRPAATATSTATRRAFPTSVGRVIVELDAGAPRDAIFTAFIEASLVLKHERLAERGPSSASGP